MGNVSSRVQGTRAESGSKEVMCAYNRFEGEPCCGSNRLLTQILRDDWGFEGLVVTDCGAIGDFFQRKNMKRIPTPHTLPPMPY